MANDIPAPKWRRLDARVSRRDALAGLGAASLLQPFAVVAQQTASCTLTPDSGEGPFYFDPMLLRSDIVDGHPGAPLDVEIEVLSADGCRALEAARVDLWHADGLGRTFLRGTQLTSAEGRVGFRTIYPSWYGGRTPHLHFKVFLSEREVIAGQIFFPDDVNEEVFSSWDPYRQHRQRRRVFNSNDMFLVDGALQGAIADVDPAADGFRARASLAVAER
jgi:protocatechuate 3,4-dioxygenase beta subunit